MNNVVIVHIEVGYQADAMGAGGVAKHMVVCFKSFHKRVGGGLRLEIDHIRGRVRVFYRNARNAGDVLGEQAGAAMVFGKSLDMVLQGVDAGCSENAYLAHSTTEHFAHAFGLLDELVRAAEHGADRASRPLERQKVRLSAHAANWATGVFVAIEALKMRAPSMWTRT